MADAPSAELKLALKQLVIEECDKEEEFSAADIGDSDALLGGELELDSLDVLQICMAVKKQYNVRIEGNTAARRALKSIDTLAQTICDNGPR